MMKKLVSCLLALLLLLAGCASPEPIVINGATYLPFEADGFSFYYPQNVSIISDDDYLFSAAGEDIWMGVSVLDYAASAVQLDDAALLDSACEAVIAELCTQTGVEAENFSVSEKSSERTTVGERSTVLLSYSVSVDLSGYGLELSTSVVQLIVPSSSGLYVVTLRSDAGSAAEVFADLISTIECD